MEVKQHFKCKLWRTDLERFRLICKFLDIPMSVMCGLLIERFNDEMKSKMIVSDSLKDMFEEVKPEETKMIFRRYEKLLSVPCPYML